MFRMKKLIAFLMAATLCLGMLSVGAWALELPDVSVLEDVAEAVEAAETDAPVDEAVTAVEEAPALLAGDAVSSGSCGDNVTWTLENGVLTLSGTGPMTNYSRYADVPWADFRGKIKSVVIEDGVTTIGDIAFYACYFTSIDIPEGVIYIGSSAFSRSSLKEIVIPEGVTAIGGSAFEVCGDLTSVTMPSSVTSIGAYAFSRCAALTSIDIPEGVTSISEGVFNGCSGLASIHIPEGVDSIGIYAFNGCSGLTSITIPEGVTFISANAFSNCSGLTSVTVPEGVTSIRNDAFAYCTSLKTVILPRSVTEIDIRAFQNCGAITDVYYAGPETQWTAVSVISGNDDLLNAALHCNAAVIGGEVLDLSCLDVDGDGKRNGMDIVALMKAIAGLESDAVENRLDVNADGRRDILDVIRLVRLLAMIK